MMVVLVENRRKFDVNTGRNSARASRLLGLLYVQYVTGRNISRWQQVTSFPFAALSGSKTGVNDVG